jgi:hypothetical protein
MYAAIPKVFPVFRVFPFLFQTNHANGVVSSSRTSARSLKNANNVIIPQREADVGTVFVRSIKRSP